MVNSYQYVIFPSDMKICCSYLRNVLCIGLLFIGLETYASARLVVVGPPSPPYWYLDQDNQIQGVDAEVLNTILSALNLTYTMHICPLKRCMSMLNDGKADIGVSIPVARLTHDEDILILPSRSSEITLWQNENGAKKDSILFDVLGEGKDRIGITEDVGSRTYIKNRFPYAKGVDPSSYFNIGTAEYGLKMLNAGRLNYLISDRIVGQYLQRKWMLKNIKPLPYVLGFQTKATIFSKSSFFESPEISNIIKLRKLYAQELNALRQEPEFYQLSNLLVEDLSAVNLSESRLSSSGEDIHIGFLADLSGPSSGWGKPGITGIRLYVDYINSLGGLLVNAERHRLVLHIIDDESSPDQALAGAKHLVEEHQVQFISAIGGDSADATHPYLTEKKVIYASLIASDIHQTRPYLLAGGDVTPRFDMLRPWYHMQHLAGGKRWAVISQNDSVGRNSQSWEVGAAMASGWDVVHDQHFPVDVKNFENIAKELIASDPDVISLNLSWPEFVVDIVAELYKQNYQGQLSANYLDLDELSKVVPIDYLEGAIDSFPSMGDPYWGKSSQQHEFYLKWNERFGSGKSEDIGRPMNGIDWNHLIMLQVWTFGVQLAQSFDADKVIAAIQKQPTFPTLLGDTHMSGKALWGRDNMASPPIPINRVKQGHKQIEMIIRFEDWFEGHQEEIVNIVRQRGFFWAEAAGGEARVLRGNGSSNN